MSCSPVHINTNENTVAVTNNTATITVVDNNICQDVTVVQETTNVVEVVSFGPAGQTGATGQPGPSGSSAPFYQIGTSNVWYTTSSLQITGSVTVSGSSTFTNIGPAIFSGSVQAPSITGSLFGTASYALTSSYVENAISSSFATTASYALGPYEILQYTAFANFPTQTAATNTLYLDQTAGNLYRWDNTSSQYILLNSQTSVNPSGSDDSQLYFVDLATRARLNACTYNNGTNGVGATLTGNSNGALSEFDSSGTIDNVVAATGNIILVRAQTSALQNGIYEVTNTGSAAAPFILTRADYYDSGSEMYPSLVTVINGSNYKNSYFVQQTVNPTVGTSNIVFGAATSPADNVTLPVYFIDTVTSASLPSATYTNGTLYTATLPGFQATLTATANGPLGAINGVTVTSGMRILVVSQSNLGHNGSYIVTQPGSSTTPWRLTRIDYANQTFNPRAREWVVSRTGSLEFGSRYVISSASLTDANIGTQPIRFIKYGSVAAGGSGAFATSASFAATASYVLNAVSSSFATTASFTFNALSASYAATASLAPNYVLTAVTSSMTVLSASFAISSSTARSASFATTASYVLNAVSSSFAATASLAPNYVLNSVTSSMTVLSASFASTASFVNPLNQTVTISGQAGTTLLTVGGDTFLFTGSIFVSGAVVITGSVAASSFTGSLLGTSSNAVSSSFATTASYVLNAVSSSYALTASFIDGGLY